MHSIPELAFETLTHVTESWREERYVVIGAIALLAHGVKLSRNTNDVDVVVATGANDLPRLRGNLSPPGWEQVRRRPHKFEHPTRGLKLDVIPSARSPERIQLARGQELDLRGCDIAVDHAVPITVRGAKDTLTIRVPPLLVIALLKLIAIDDNPHLRADKDVHDLVRMARHLLPDDAMARWEPPLSTIPDHELQCMGQLGLSIRPYARVGYSEIPERVLGHRDVLGRLEAVFSGPNRDWPDDERGRGWSGEEIIAAFLRGFLHE